MVKFSKELEAQLIPEWKDKFLDYRQLKKHIKRIRLSRKPKHLISPDSPGSFGRSIFDTIRSIADIISHKFHPSDPIQVKNKTVELQGEEEEVDEEANETEYSTFFSQEDEEKRFFDRLDEELEKVNQFYKDNESKLLEKWQVTEKQLQVLLDLKKILHDRRHKKSPSLRSPRFSLFPSLNSSSAQNSDCSGNNTPEESNHFSEDTGSETEEVIAALERNGLNLIGGAEVARSKMKKLGKPRTALRIDIPATTPGRAATMLWEEVVNSPNKECNSSPNREVVNRKKIQCAEKMIRGAFVELYRGLGLLKTYGSLNMVAFTKILKKFDKVANKQESDTYLQKVKASHFINSDKVVRKMNEVESLFIQHFAENDRKKAMKFLRPQQQKESHMVTFFVGLFTGCFVTLFAVYAILAHLSGLLSSSSNFAYMETVYPIFSMFALMSLHLFMYGCNLLMWKATKINFTFIFEFSPKTSLKYRDAFLLCTSLMTAVVGALVLHLLLRSSGFSPQQVDILPGILLLIFLALLICPLNIFYRSTRFCFLRVMRNIIFSPLYKVLMMDFFMADQLTSQIPLLRHMETIACYFLAGTFRTHQYDVCKSGRLYRELAYVISFSPYYWRAMQCARRWLDESDPVHLANLGKYVSAMVAAGARLTYAQQPGPLWMIIVVLTSVTATVYQLYWDFVRDWGLLNPTSSNPWLRDHLILKHKFIYYLSIAANVVLRVVWVEAVMKFHHVGMIESKFLDFSLASLEVIRRGHWNFYRMENEHLNNVGRFRAVKEVPLPFRETDSDG